MLGFLQPLQHLKILVVSTIAGGLFGKNYNLESGVTKVKQQLLTQNTNPQSHKTLAPNTTTKTPKPMDCVPWGSFLHSISIRNHRLLHLLSTAFRAGCVSDG